MQSRKQLVQVQSLKTQLPLVIRNAIDTQSELVPMICPTSGGLMRFDTTVTGPAWCEARPTESETFSRWKRQAPKIICQRGGNYMTGTASARDARQELSC